MTTHHPEIVAGIDLGTTFSAVTVQTLGKVEPMLFPGIGPQCPSAILWQPDGQHLIGQAALNAAFKDPEQLHTHFKRGLLEAADVSWNGGPTPVDLSSVLLRGIWKVLLQAHAEIAG